MVMTVTKAMLRAVVLGITGALVVVECFRAAIPGNGIRT